MMYVQKSIAFLVFDVYMVFDDLKIFNLIEFFFFVHCFLLLLRQLPIFCACVIIVTGEIFWKYCKWLDALRLLKDRF